MIKKQYFLFAFALIGLLLVISPMASALDAKDADFTVKQYAGIDIKKPCLTNASTWCSTAAQCNITVVYVDGNGIILYNNTEMTGQGSYFNLTLKPHDTDYTGWYMGQMVCSDGALQGDEQFYWQVTPTGAESNTSMFLIIGAVLIVVVLLGYLLSNLYIVAIGGMAATILGIYSMVQGFAGVQNDYTRMIAVIAIGIGLILFLSSAYSLVNSYGDTGYEEVIDTEEGFD